MDPSREISHQEAYPLTNLPIKIRFIESEDYQEEDMWTIDIGNTGLLVIIYDDVAPHANQHFLPDNNDKAVPGKEIQYGLTYAFAIHALVEWWIKNKDSLPDNIPRFNTIPGTTNKAMHEFRIKLLGNSYHDLGNDGDEYFYELDLNKLCQDQVVLIKLSKLAQKCSKQNYKTT